MSNPFNLVPGRLNINAVSGDDFAVLLQFKDEDGVAINLSSYTFEAKILIDNAPGNRYQIITVTNTNLTEGRITLSLSDAQTQALGALSNRKWFITWSQGGETRTVLSGTFTLNQKWGVTDYSPTTENQTIIIETPTISIEVIGGVGGAVIWGDIQGDIENQTDLIQFLEDNYTKSSSIPVGTNAVFEGDSLTTDVSPPSGNGNDYPQKFSELPEFLGNYVNVASSGNTLANIASQYGSQVFPLSPSETGNSAKLFVWIGANDITTLVSVSDYLNSLKSYWDQARDDGFEVIAFTVTPRLLSITQEIKRVQLNDLIRSCKGVNYDYLIDVASMFPDSKASYFMNDNLHISALGNLIIANSIFPILLSNFQITPLPNIERVFTDGGSIYSNGAGTLFPLAIRLPAGQPLTIGDGSGGAQCIINGTGATMNYDLRDAGTQKASFYTLTGYGQGIKYRDILRFDNYSINTFILDVSGNGVFTGTVTASNLSGTNTGNQYGSVTASAANQYLRRNAANSAYEFAPKTEYITIVPTDGQAIAFNDNPNDQVFYINPAGDLADLQLILPSNSASVNGQKAVYCITKNIATLAFTGATTIFNAPVSANAGDCLQFYKMASNVWARVIT